VRLLSKLQ